MLLVTFLTAFSSAVTLEPDTFIQTSGTNYNLSVLINTTLDTLTVTSTNITFSNPTFIALQNVNTTNNSEIVINNSGNLILLYDNGTMSFVGNQTIFINGSQRVYLYSISQQPLSSGALLISELNENSGTIANDVSGNSNNGVIFGATWDNDGILITLVENIEYTINKVFGIFTMTSSQLSFAELILSYSYSLIKEGFDNIITNLTGGVNTFFTFSNVWFTLLAIVLLIIIVMAVINVVSKRETGGFAN